MDKNPIKIIINKINVGSENHIDLIVEQELDLYKHLIEMHEHTPEQAAEVAIRSGVQDMARYVEKPK